MGLFSVPQFAPRNTQEKIRVNLESALANLNLYKDNTELDYLLGFIEVQIKGALTANNLQ
jgi:hypothetical protein